MRKGTFSGIFLAFFIFLFITLIFFIPLLSNLSTKIINDYDGLHNVWCLNAIIQNLLSSGGKALLSPEKLMEGNIFYPYHYSIAFNDPFITDSLIALPFFKATGEPLVAFNVNLVVSQLLLLFFSFLFLFELCSNLIISLLFSLLFSFSEIRLHYFYVGHLNMFSLFWVPLAGFSLLRLANTSKPIFIYLFFFSFSAQVLNSFLGGYFIIFLTISLVIFSQKIRQAIKDNLIHFLFGGVVTIAVTFPVIRLYLHISNLYHYSRSIRDAIHFSLSPEELLTKKFFSPALFVTFLATFVYFIFKKKKEKKISFFLFLSAFFLLMALGPALHFFFKTIKISFLGKTFPIPLPYAIFYYLLPGFKGFRTPSRWIFMFGFSLASFSAMVISDFLAKQSKIKRIFVYLFLSFLFLFSFPVPKNYFSFPAIKNYPAVYYWLKDQPGKVILEIPIYYWGDFVNGKKEPAQMVYSLLHKKRTVNGYGSFSPKEWEDWIVFLRRDLPSQESIFKIKESGVDYLVVHRDELKDFWQKDYQKKMELLKASNFLREIYKDDKDTVYSF